MHIQLAKLADTSRFKADKGFQGTEAYAGSGPRSEPVQFEKQADHNDESYYHGRQQSNRGRDVEEEDRAGKRYRRE